MSQPTYRIPDPPKGMFTPAEWAAIQAKRAERVATGTSCVGEYTADELKALRARA